MRRKPIVGKLRASAKECESLANFAEGARRFSSELYNLKTRVIC